MKSSRTRMQTRFGIGEWFGKPFASLAAAERRELNARRTQAVKPPCPYRSSEEKPVSCSKAGGVCSLRAYQMDSISKHVEPVPGAIGMLRTTCPSRFLESQVAFAWVGETLLGCSNPLLLREVPYLKPAEMEGHEVFGEDFERSYRIGGTEDEVTGDSVGSVDFVLVHPNAPSTWCALEMQAVYFSGDTMTKDFAAVASADSDGIPFPAGRRRPDYRSSGPKRLMPQLQTKVPSLRRWGKKIAVVVDQWFWASLGKMRRVDDVSNCDIAWFVVRYDETDGASKLCRHTVYLTTLEAAIEGLTAGQPVSLATFEQYLRDKMADDRPRGRASRTIVR